VFDLPARIWSVTDRSRPENIVIHSDDFPMLNKLFAETFSPPMQWEHITFSRLTTFYFIFSILHCLIQVILQVQAFTSNARAATFLHSILMQGNATDTNGFTVLGENDLRMCDRVPNGFSTSTCRVIWNGTALTNDAAPSSSSASPAFQTALLPPNATSIAVPSSASSTSVSTPMQLPSQNAATLSKPSIDDDDNYYMKGEVCFRLPCPMMH
jgi:hypothetical protein